MPANFSASQPTTGSAKKPSFSCEWRDGGRCRQHSRLPKTMSAAWSSSIIFRNGSEGSATFIKLMSPVKISFFAKDSPPRQNPADGRDSPLLAALLHHDFMEI